MAVYSVPPHIILGSHTSMCALHGLCMRFFWCVGLQLKEVAEYLRARKVSPELRRRVFDYYEYRYMPSCVCV